VRRVKKSTRCYNKMVACTEVAMVERRRVIDFVERKLRCRCGAFLHFDRARSQQVGVCAAWQFQCQKSCNIPPLHTSAQVHGDDYELNAKLNYAISTCALSFARMVPFLFFLGMGAPSNADHYATKAEITPILANAAERSMAEAHARNVVAGDTEFISFDGGFTAPRNAHGCTGAAHAKDSAIIEIVHRRLTDVGAKTSKSLEVLCYTALLCCPRVHIYATVVMDGCRELVRPTHAAGKRAQGDMWHSGKNWSKWYEPAAAMLCRVPKKAAQAAVRVVQKVVIAADRLEPYGERPKDVSACEFARQRVRELGGEAPDSMQTPALKTLFTKLARAHAMTEAEQLQEAERQRYEAELAKRKEVEVVATAARGPVPSRSEAAYAKIEVLAWRRDLRGMQRYIAEYTRDLRGTLRSGTEHEWTDYERGAEFLRLWRDGCVKLVLGRVGEGADATLHLIKHPIAFPPGAPGSTRKTAWVPPGKGHVRRWRTNLH
jgi:hypothetical protein